MFGEQEKLHMSASQYKINTTDLPSDYSVSGVYMCMCVEVGGTPFSVHGEKERYEQRDVPVLFSDVKTSTHL